MNYIQVLDYKPILRACFETDQEFLDKYHVASGSGLDGCVDRTFEDLKDATEYKFYKIEKDKGLVGYFGEEFLNGQKYMTGFFLNPEFRNKEDIVSFWKLIKGHFNGPFLVGIYKKNKRALNFLLKSANAKIIIDVDAQDGYFLEVA